MPIVFENWRASTRGNSRGASRWLATALWPLALLACGETRDLGGVRCGNGAAEELIDDMEDGDDVILQTQGRGDHWFVYSDDTNLNGGNARQEPTTGKQFEPAELDPPRPTERGPSRYAVHTRGEGFVEWGAGVRFDINLRKPYDATLYQGVSFWMRSGNPELTDQVIRVSLVDEPRDPALDLGKYVSPGPEWEKVTLYWPRDFEEPPWSGPLPDLNPAALVGMKFQAPQNEPFDFYIDDVAFVCQPPDAAAEP